MKKRAIRQGDSPQPFTFPVARCERGMQGASAAKFTASL